MARRDSLKASGYSRCPKGLVVHKPTGASVGVAFFDGTHTELEEMLRLADETMYEVKRAGKGNVLVRSF